jgi:cob(I)alamin adenosyltransferase
MSADNTPSSTASVASESKSDQYKKSSIYTRKGDDGLTSLYNMQRLCKAESYFQALGSVDELNSTLGICNAYAVIEDNGLSSVITDIQMILFDIGAALATPITTSTAEQLERVKFDPNHIKDIEGTIDRYDSGLARLTHFILPSGGLCASHLHLARSIARRAEREAVPIIQQGDVDQTILVYLNRLSDLFFVLARYAAKQAGNTETQWIKKTASSAQSK